jgi:hypothetical protein
MEWLLVLVVLLDVFFTVLHYDGLGSSAAAPRPFGSA